MNFSGISDKSLAGRVLRWPLKLIPADSTVRILQGPLRGKKWIAGASEHGCWLGSFEFAKQKLFSATVKRGQTIYDLGANVGFYSLLASVLAGPEGKVFSFEPLPRNLALLRRHLELNRISNCEIWDVAVARTSGTAKFDPGPTDSRGFLTSDSSAGIMVRTAAIDELISTGQIPPPQVIKCDIEGGEFDALVGGNEMLRACRPVIFLATHGRDVHERCCRLLADLNYALAPLDGHSIDQTYEILAAPA